MGRYTNFDEISARYNLVQAKGEATVESSFLMFAENEVDSLLGQKFTLPFSSNNLTVKDLAIEFAYLRLGNFKVIEREKVRAALMKRIERLLDGSEAMVLDDGTTLIQSTGGTVYSTTGDYHPIFGFGDVEDAVVDSSLLTDEADARL